MIKTPEEVLAMPLPKGSGLRFQEKGNFINLIYRDDQITAFNKDNLDSETIENCILNSRKCLKLL